MGLSMTNFSKNRDPSESINFNESNFIVKNKKARKGKLPSLMDDSKVTPRKGKQFQFSTDFTKGTRKKRNLDGVNAGYDTDFTGGGGGFNSTYEDGFTGLFDSTNEGDHSSTQYGHQKLPFMSDFPTKDKNAIKK